MESQLLNSNNDENDLGGRFAESTEDTNSITGIRCFNNQKDIEEANEALTVECLLAHQRKFGKQIQKQAQSGKKTLFKSKNGGIFRDQDHTKR